jgi:hypothetical protein
VHRVGAIALVGLLAGCTGQPTSPSNSTDGTQTASQSIGPTASPMATNATAAPPTAAPEASATPVTPDETPLSGGGGWAKNPPQPVLLNRAVRVVVAELNMRERPTTSAKRVWTMSRDLVLGVNYYPPVRADGYTWYFGTTLRSEEGHLPPLPENPHAVIDPIGGWFAAGKGSIEYVEPIPPRCPAVVELPNLGVSEVDLRNLGVMLAQERLSCFEDFPIEFEGTYGCPGCTPELFGDFRPRWLADPNIVNFVGDPNGFGILLRFPREGTGPPTDGSIIRVRGHFDDPAASSCELAFVEPWGDMVPAPAPSSFAEHWCRQMFVVDRYDVIGTDPAFPS